MNRYLVFGFGNFYPYGGCEDIIGRYDDLKYVWYDILNTEYDNYQFYDNISVINLNEEDDNVYSNVYSEGYELKYSLKILKKFDIKFEKIIRNNIDELIILQDNSIYHVNTNNGMLSQLAKKDSIE